MKKKLSVKKQALVNAMKAKYSHIAHACEACNLSRGTFYNWYEKDELFREKIDDIRSTLDDSIETTAIAKCLKEKDTTLIMFMLRTRMRSRGYIEKQEVQTTGEFKLLQETSIDFSKLSVEELRKLKELTEKAKKDNKEK